MVVIALELEKSKTEYISYVDDVQEEHKDVEEVGAKVLNIKIRFWVFSLVASLNHALNYVVNSYATSILDQSLGGVVLGLGWTLNSVSGLTIATPTVRRFGSKYSMIIAFVGYTFQLFSVYVAAVDSSIAWPIAILGAIVSGFTSAIWWTAQGVYFETSCLEISKCYAKEQQEEAAKTARTMLSAHWTMIYQGCDIVVFMTLSVVPIYLGIPVTSVLLALSIMGLATVVAGFFLSSLPGDDSKELSWAAVKVGVAAVPRQYANDARAGLFSPFVFGFGISTAMFAFHVNSEVSNSHMGENSLGYLEAYSYFIAILAAYPYALVMQHVSRGQDWVIQFGSLSFLLSGVVVLALTENQLTTWAAMLGVKTLYGLGRGVFEGSCRAVYAEMFTGEDLATAFSGQTLSAGLSGGICFFIFGTMSKDGIASVTMSNGVFAIACYFVLMFAIDSKTSISWSRTLAALVKCMGSAGPSPSGSLKGSLLTDEERSQAI